MCHRWILCTRRKDIQVAAASKAFNRAFSNALNEEYAKRIDVLSVNPGMVRTPMTKKVEGFGVVEVEDVVKDSLRKLGNLQETCGHWKHELIGESKFMHDLFYKRVLEKEEAAM